MTAVTADPSALLGLLHKRTKASWSSSTPKSRIPLARACIAALEEDSWSTAGNWLAASADVEKVPPEERLNYGSTLRFVTGTTTKTFLECFIKSASGAPLNPCESISFGPAAPGVTFSVITAEENAPEASLAAANDSLRAAPNTVTVVLGVGNQPFLTLIDVLQRVFVYGETVLLKQHPLRPYLEHPYKILLAPLIDDNIVHLVQDQGIPATIAILSDPRVGHVHMTGAEATAKAIQKTLDANPSSPALTSELGCSTPWILAPAEYTEVELNKAAAAAVSQKKLNGGSNCLDLQVLVVSSAWPQKKAFLEAVKRSICESKTPACYYPGVDKTYNAMKAHYEAKGKILLEGETTSDVTIVDCGTYGTPTFDNFSTKNEAFCPILAWVEVEGNLSALTEFCNSDDLCGSLSCALLSPASADADEVEAALKNLKYGTVAHNISNTLGYTTLGLGGLWGAYPGEVRSGIGIVGNLHNVKGAVKQIVRSSNGLSKMMTDVSIPPFLADILHKALNVGGGRFGALGTISRVCWLCARRLTHNTAVTLKLVDAKAKLPGSAIIQK
mmetsp:Transcript_15820/g.32510  ORF Transcript_15820/g.32510 Transcript_15820/m.32510 type:complete len:558 (-) Transcript_15820:25-1698(-)